MIALLLLGTLQVTSYRPIPAQTKPECVSRDSCRTASDDAPTRYGVAVSQDFLRSGALHYGDVLYIPGFGFRVVNDCMNARYKAAIDLLVYTRAEEKQVGVRHLQVFKVGSPINER